MFAIPKYLFFYITTHNINIIIMSNLLQFWFPSSLHGEETTINKYQAFWFDGSKDLEIFDNFNEELIQAENKNLEEILSFDNDTKFYYLILFDQITRNISRLTNENEFRNDKKALQIAMDLIAENYDMSLPFQKKMFILLPHRHTGALTNLDFVISRLNTYHANLQETEKADYQRFYIATLKNYTTCTENISIFSQQRGKIEVLALDKNSIFSHQIGKIEVLAIDKNSVLFFSPREIVYDETIHDENCRPYTQLVSNTIVKDLEKNKLYQSVLAYCRKYRIKRLGVSLSGGVDSMVLLFLLRQMVLRGDLEIVVAIHVDYNWRNTSNQEAKYMMTFCSHIGVDIILRDVKHFNAEVDTKIYIEREVVEEETKQIRFNTYKYAIQKYDLVGICLGHHKDDLIENVFMNFAKGKNILDLFVTEEYSLQYDVNILRPMLGHHKPDIFDIAHENNIIYFKDTTPDWSFRGTMRRKIFPTMDNFDKMILGNFYRMGQQSAEWGGFIKNKIIKPILASAKTYKYGMSFELNIDYTDIPTAFWSELLVNFFHSKSVHMISQKNLHSYIEWINRKGSEETLFRLSNGHMAFRDKTKFYFIKTDFYERLKSELNNQKYSLKIDPQFSDKIKLKAGLWNIEISNSSTCIISSINYEDILNGSFEYTVFLKTSDFIVSSREKNKTFKEVSLLSHIIPKIIDCKDTRTIDDLQIIFVSCTC
jgi:tRNA(Ile)-lysidine synthetase-like protein